MPAAFTLEPDDVRRALDTTFDGLTSAEAARRLTLDGPNELAQAVHRPAWKLLAAQFTNVLVIILLAATALTMAVGHTVEAVTIGVIVVAAALLGFAQEYRAEKAIDVLRQMATPGALVLRDGRESPIESRLVVRGDVLILRAGNRIPADGRIFDASALEAQESALTGESAAVAKTTGALADRALVAGDQTNMAFAGTLVASGRGRALVVATGSRTEFGRIAHLLGSIDTSPTPLQVSLDGLAKMLARAAIGLLAVVAAVGLTRGEELANALVFGAALAVAVVPEALPAVVTISLALGAQRMVARRALIRRLPAVETLGCTSVICSDKTGTLTRDEMTVRRIFVAGRTLEVSGTGYGPLGDFYLDGIAVAKHRFADHGLEEPLALLFAAAALASDSDVAADEDGNWLAQGEPTEGALVAMAAKAGRVKTRLEAEWPRVAEIPFTSESRWMATLHRTPDGVAAFVKGAPEEVLPMCRSQRATDGVRPLDEEAVEHIHEHAHLMADQALRVLALATRIDATTANSASDLEFLGLVGIADPPREEAKAAISKCAGAGIRVAMITGDHPRTARAVATELGLLTHGRVVTGRELELLGDDELRRDVDSIQVFARVSPEQKLRIVSALQANGHVVAVTGDGVNDAPALKKADIGIAMGIKGTDVAREAAAVTLTDDNFASIVAAIEEGRTIFGNIKKYLMFLLSSNVGEIGLMAGALVAGLPMPLMAVQILFVNLATDGLPALALAVDPPDPDVMDRPPRDPNASVFARRARMLMLTAGAWSAIANLALFAWVVQAGTVEHARTVTFVSLIVIQLVNAYNFRSDQTSVFDRPFANAWLNAVIVTEVAVLVAVVVMPGLQSLFGTQPLTQADWLMVAAVGLSSVVVLELGKWLARRGVGWFA